MYSEDKVKVKSRNGFIAVYSLLLCAVFVVVTYFQKPFEWYKVFFSFTFKPIQVITSLLTLFHVKNIKIEKKCYSKGFFYHTCMSNFVLDETKTPCKIF